MENALDRVQKDVKQLLNKDVVFTKKEGQKRVEYTGKLVRVYKRTGLIELDPTDHNFETYSFSFIHLFMNEGTLTARDME